MVVVRGGGRSKRFLWLCEDLRGEGGVERYMWEMVVEVDSDKRG